MSTELVTQQQQAVQQWKSPSQIKQRIEAIQELMTQVLKKDTDFGIIPGMPKGTKPSLWKPGSEQILAMFQIACEPVVEDLSVEDCYRYRVTTRLTNVQTGEFLGAGIGEASTDETKYKWKACYSKAEFDATDPGRRRMKYSSWQGKDTEQMQVRQEPADLANTILKMAKKRSQIDATLTVTGASSMFEQDLEDLPEDTRQEMARQRGGKKKAETAPVGDTMCGECRQVNGHHPLCKYFKGTPPAAAQAAPAEAAPVKPQETTNQAVEPPQKPGNTKMAVKINSVSERSKVKDGNKQIYLVLGVVDPNNNEWDLYVWHKTLQERAATLANRSALIEFSQKTSNGRTYCSLEAILEVVGEQASEPDDDF